MTFFSDFLFLCSLSSLQIMRRSKQRERIASSVAPAAQRRKEQRAILGKNENWHRVFPLRMFAARVASRSIARSPSRSLLRADGRCIHGRRQSSAESLTGSAGAATACNLYIEKYALMAPNIELTRLDVRRSPLAARRFDCKCDALFVSILAADSR